MGKTLIILFLSLLSGCSITRDENRFQIDECVQTQKSQNESVKTDIHYGPAPGDPQTPGSREKKSEEKSSWWW